MKIHRLLLAVPLLLALLLPARAETVADHPPRPLKQVPPHYTKEMKQNRPKGDVIVDFVVDEKGAVTNAKVQTSLSPEADKAALESVQQWKFEPAVQGGRVVKTRVQVPVRFT